MNQQRRRRFLTDGLGESRIAGGGDWARGQGETGRPREVVDRGGQGGRHVLLIGPAQVLLFCSNSGSPFILFGIEGSDRFQRQHQQRCCSWRRSSLSGGRRQDPGTRVPRSRRDDVARSARGAVRRAGGDGLVAAAGARRAAGPAGAPGAPRCGDESRPGGRSWAGLEKQLSLRARRGARRTFLADTLRTCTERTLDAWTGTIPPARHNPQWTASDPIILLDEGVEGTRLRFFLKS